MFFVWISALKDLRRQLKDPMALIIWIGIPLAISGLIFLAFGGGGGGEPPEALVLVADQDSTFISGLVFQAMTRTPTFQVRKVSEDVGRLTIEKGKATAFLIIPEGFGDAVLNELDMALPLTLNPSQRILPLMVEETLSILVDGIFYAERLIGEDLRRLSLSIPSGGGPPDSVVAGISVAINRVMNRIGPTLLPPVVQVKTEVEKTKTTTGFGPLFFPGILFMALLFMSQGLAGDVWVEHEQGTLRRAATLPRRMEAFLAGKLLAGGAIIGLVCVVGATIGRILFGFPLERLLIGWIWSVFAGTVFLCLLMMAQLHSGSQNGGNLLTSFILFPLLMIGGSFFPFEAMPAWMARIGKLTPNGWALTQLKTILLSGPEIKTLSLAFLGLVVMGGLGFFLSARRLAGGFVAGK